MSTHAAAHPRLRSRNRTTIPRRRSGKAARPKAGFGDAVVATGKRLGDARVLDRLVRGRAWIAIVAVLLLGIVFMQVSLLRLNAQIGTAVTASENLDRANSGLRADIAQLDSGERIQAVAAKLGMVMPPAGQVHFLNAREANPALAAASITAPKPVTQQAAAPVVQQQAAPVAQAAPVVQAAPVAQAAPVVQQASATAPATQQTP